MTAQLFDEYTTYSEERLREHEIPDEQVAFLSSIGLPTWCAPNMHFGEVGEAWMLLPIFTVGMKKYLALGEDRDGRAIVMALSGYSVWVIPDHGCPVYFACDVLKLSEAVHNFQVCIDAAVESDSLAYTENRVSPRFMAPFISWVSAEDPEAIKVGSFWHSVLLWLGMPNMAVKVAPVGRWTRRTRRAPYL